MPGSPLQETTVSTPTKSKSTAASPAKPIVFNSPSGIFFYKKQASAGKTQGYTPNRVNTVPLAKYEGDSHLRARGTDSTTIISSDSPLKSHSSQSQMQLKARLRLRALLPRADSDYYFAVRGTLDPSHYLTMQRKINEFIRLARRVMSSLDNTESQNFLDMLNDDIQKKKAYNPFFLNRLYADSDSTNYNYTLAELSEQWHQAITLPQLSPPKIVKSTLAERLSKSSTLTFGGLYDGLPLPKASAAKTSSSTDSAKEESKSLVGLYDGLPLPKASAAKTSSSTDSAKEERKPLVGL